MTDNEIIKALECCVDCNCEECPCYKKVCGQKRCTEIDEEEILNLINRQKAEIESLSDNLIVERTRRENAVSAYHEAKTKAYKEFAKRLKTALSGKIVIRGIHDEEETDLDSAEVWQVIDNLAKEMIGGE